MGIRCYPCGWHGEISDLVPATPEWCFEHDVDPDHFLNNNLNCPDCGESGPWQMTGEDAFENMDPHEFDE